MANLKARLLKLEQQRDPNTPGELPVWVDGMTEQQLTDWYDQFI